MAKSIYKCIFDFQGETESDLSLKVGDLIQVTQVINDDWLEGSLNGKKGQFPTAFVEKCQDVFDVCVALSDFNAEQDGDLSLKTGELVVITDIVDDSWMSGYVKGGSHGMFPRNFVRAISFDSNIQALPKEETSLGVIEKATEKNSSDVTTTVEVLFDFKAYDANEINLKEGEFVEILEETDEFWCKGKTCKGDEGVFPREFVNLPKWSLTQTKSKDQDDKNESNTAFSVTYTDKETPGQLHTTEGDVNLHGIGTALAEFDYCGTVEGDLSFSKGEEIILLEKIDENWYKGLLNHVSGVFPANYVSFIEMKPNVQIESTLELPLVIKQADVQKPSKKKPPDRPKPPAVRKPHEYIPFCYQFNTGVQPTVIIPHEKLKKGQQNILQLRVSDNAELENETSNSLGSRSPMQSKKNPRVTPSHSSGYISSDTTQQFLNGNYIRDSTYHNQYSSNEVVSSMAASNNYETGVSNARKAGENTRDSYKSSESNQYSSYATTGVNDAQKGIEKIKDSYKSNEGTARKEFDSVSKNIPDENMSTYQKMKCANNNLNTAVTVANAVGIKTTKTELAKGAVKMGALTYVTGSKSSKGSKPPPAMKSALKGLKK